MATDKHFNEPGGLPEPLEDHQPNDKPATISMFVVMAIVAAIAIGALAVYQVM